jgi:hypothetical protein
VQILDPQTEDEIQATAKKETPWAGQLPVLNRSLIEKAIASQAFHGGICSHRLGCIISVA